MLLEIQGLRYSLEHKIILEDLHFKIPKVQITAVLGANGAGKSTLLQLIAGLLDPKEGKILFKGKEVLGPSHRLVPGHPNIALVRQDSRLLPMHTVRDNLRYVLRAYEEAYQGQKMEELVALLGIEPTLDRVVKYLSGGEQQRVAIAAALASNPELLLMDEPFSQTDMYVKQDLKHYLREVVRQLDVGILFVTHDPEEALALSDEILVLHNGKLIEHGKSKNLYYRPQQEVTAVLTGLCNWLPKDVFNKVTGLHSVGEFWLLRPDQISLHLVPEEGYYEANIEKVEFTGFYNRLQLRIQKENFSLLCYQISTFGVCKQGETIWLSFVPPIF